MTGPEVGGESEDDEGEEEDESNDPKGDDLKRNK